MFALKMTSGLADLSKELKAEQQALRRAAQRGLNAAARGLVTDTVKTLRERYPRLKAGDVRSFMRVSYATLENLRAEIVARGRPLGLSRFVVRQNKKPGGGVTVQVKNGAKVIPHAFVQAGRDFGGSRSQVVFIRGKYAPGSGAAPTALVALRTFNVPDAMNIIEVRATLNRLTNERFDNEYTRQIRLYQGSKNRW